MINSSKFTEKFLQNQRFKRVIPFLTGDVLDFGGNEGELKNFVKGEYTLVNYDHSQLKNKTFDTIVALAVIEHIEPKEVFKMFKMFKPKLRANGKVFLTTPTKMSKPVLEVLASLKILDKKNIEEHKHYWNKEEICKLANKSGFKFKAYKKFQFGFNQFAVLEHI